MGKAKEKVLVVAKTKGKEKLKDIGKVKDKQKVKEVAKEDDKEKALWKRKVVQRSSKKKEQMNNRDVVHPTYTHLFSCHAFCVELNVHICDHCYNFVKWLNTTGFYIMVNKGIVK